MLRIVCLGMLLIMCLLFYGTVPCAAVHGASIGYEQTVSTGDSLQIAHVTESSLVGSSQNDLLRTKAQILQDWESLLSQHLSEVQIEKARVRETSARFYQKRQALGVLQEPLLTEEIASIDARQEALTLAVARLTDQEKQVIQLYREFQEQKELFFGISDQLQQRLASLGQTPSHDRTEASLTSRFLELQSVHRALVSAGDQIVVTNNIYEKSAKKKTT